MVVSWTLCALGKGGGREREVQAIEKGRTLGPSHRERENATEAQFVVDVVKRRVETVLEPKAAVTQIIAAELELKNTLESTVMLKLRAPGFVSVHVAICVTAVITKEATVG